MLRVVGWLAVLVVVAVVATYFWLQRAREPVAPPAPSVVETPPAAPAEPQIRFPLPATAEQALPKLDESDSLMRDALSGLSDTPTLAEQLLFADFVRRLVATIDNIPTPRINLRLLPVKTAPGKFMTATDADGIRLDPRNSARYAAHMKAVEALDSGRLVALYVRYYPLFQQAYEELGYPKGYFNDRLMAVIGHLLAAPEVTEPVGLVQPEEMYRFADAGMEARSAGQKVLMRIGNTNAAIVKDKLRSIRRELLALAPKPPG
jgi:hypothetical protein